ncbi:Uncharacterized protein TCM_042648 isoform 2 [Theobroma cacao]|uniref:Uncharacterized protein isoform 2 n=1 Tax=Theobroma cacao TaxID=3641 RepID=A0A061FM11_THECC|nr:Uncharacterized protein TCM_042648 isoform 2 [Theobroma cacao]
MDMAHVGNMTSRRKLRSWLLVRRQLNIWKLQFLSVAALSWRKSSRILTACVLLCFLIQLGVLESIQKLLSPFPNAATFLFVPWVTSVELSHWFKREDSHGSSSCTKLLGVSSISVRILSLLLVNPVDQFHCDIQPFK